MNKTYRIRTHIIEDVYIPATSKKMALLIRDETYGKHSSHRRVKSETVTEMTEDTGAP